jgi:predicted flap endonuclease-1-like 5' DNA nuclease
MTTGGVVMRRIVGALIVFTAALLYRGDDLLHSWKPVARAVSRPLAEPGGKAAPKSEPAAKPGGKTAPESEPAAKPKTDRSRKAPPPDYLRNPLIFLSSAPKDSLVLLPGVGPVIADRIIGARTGKRSFTKWEDLLAIKGIGPKTLERMKRLAGAANP